MEPATTAVVAMQASASAVARLARILALAFDDQAIGADPLRVGVRPAPERAALEPHLDHVRATGQPAAPHELARAVLVDPDLRGLDRRGHAPAVHEQGGHRVLVGMSRLDVAVVPAD